MFVMAYKLMENNEELSSYRSLHFIDIKICGNWNFSADVEIKVLTFIKFCCYPLKEPFAPQILSKCNKENDSDQK